MSQTISSPHLLTSHPILNFEAANITPIDSFQIFSLIAKINYDSPNHAIYVTGDIEGSELFFPSHSKISNQNLKNADSFLKFSTGSGIFNLPPDIFISDVSFNITSLTLPIFMENISFSFDDNRFAQIETQSGLLYLPARPSQYLNPLSVQLPLQSLHQYPLPPSPLLPPIRQPPPPPPTQFRPPSPRLGSTNARQEDIARVSQCLLNLSQAAKAVPQNSASADESNHHITIRDILSPPEPPSPDPNQPGPPPLLPDLAAIHKEPPIASSAKKPTDPLPVPQSDITPIQGAHALNNLDTTSSQNDMASESESYLRHLASMVSEVPPKNMEQFRNGAHYDLPAHLVPFVEDLLHHLDISPNNILLDQLFPYVFKAGNAFSTEKIKLTSSILNLLDHLHNCSKKVPNSNDTISTLKSLTTKAKGIVTRARSRHSSK